MVCGNGVQGYESIKRASLGLGKWKAVVAELDVVECQVARNSNVDTQISCFVIDATSPDSLSAKSPAMWF